MTRRRALMFCLALAIAGGAAPSAQAQETLPEHAPRAEMIDAITTYAELGGCKTLRDVFGPNLEAIAKAFAGGGSGRTPDAICKAAVSLGELSLHRAPDVALIEICTRNAIASCRKRQEASAGAPVLTFHAAVGVKGATATAAWSPDNRFLLVFARAEPMPPDASTPMGQTLVIDIQQQQSRALITDSFPADTIAAAWSPDGKYIAVNRQRAIHLYASDTLEEKGRVEPRGTRCGIYRASKMAFTADSSALWVACPSWVANDGPLAIKLGVPALQIDDRLFLEPLAPGWRARFRTATVSRRGDDLILIGVAHGWSQDKWELTARSFSLATKEPLHPPVSYLQPERSESDPDVFSTDDLSGILFRFSVVRPDGAELWSTRSGERIARLHPKTVMPGRSLGAPNRIPSTALHIEEQWLPTSPRRTLQVIDSRTGATVQEIGPVTGWSCGPGVPSAPYVPTRSILVSPDGKMVAHFGRQEIRFYRVDASAVASLTPERH